MQQDGRDILLSTLCIACSKSNPKSVWSSLVTMTSHLLTRTGSHTEKLDGLMVTFTVVFITYDTNVLMCASGVSVAAYVS